MELLFSLPFFHGAAGLSCIDKTGQTWEGSDCIDCRMITGDRQGAADDPRA